jgi:hypothetical protein
VPHLGRGLRDPGPARRPGADLRHDHSRAERPRGEVRRSGVEGDSAEDLGFVPSRRLHLSSPGFHPPFGPLRQRSVAFIDRPAPRMTELDGQPLLAHTKVRRDRVDETGCFTLRFRSKLHHIGANGSWSLTKSHSRSDISNWTPRSTTRDGPEISSEGSLVPENLEHHIGAPGWSRASPPQYCPAGSGPSADVVRGAVQSSCSTARRIHEDNNRGSAGPRDRNLSAHHPDRNTSYLLRQLGDGGPFGHGSRPGLRRGTGQVPAPPTLRHWHTRALP